MSKTLGLEDQLQHVYAAVQYLQHQRSTQDIADELGLSRFMVGRMVKRALHDGLVEVVPRLAEPVDSELSKTLASRYGLKTAIVVTPPAPGDSAARSTVAAIGARLLTEIVEEDDVIGLGPGRTIVEMCAHITEISNCDVVQLTGVADFDPAAHLLAIVQLSSVAKGRMFPLQAPFLTTDAAATAAIVGQPGVKEALKRMDQLDKAVLTIGGWPASSQLATRLEESAEIEPLMARGVVAEFGTTLLSAEGKAIPALDDRLIGISTAQLEAVSLRIALGGGPGKQEAVVATLRSGLVDVLVTDARTAQFACDAE